MAPAFLLYLEKQKRVGTLRSFRSPVPDERTFKVAAEVLALASIVAECTTIAQTRRNLSGAHVVIFTSMMMKYMNHDDPNLTVKVIDIDAPETGRITRTLIRPYNELQPESKRA